jgi:hypothetical protein
VNSTDGTEADLQAEFDRGVATGRRQAFAEAMEMMGHAPRPSTCRTRISHMRCRKLDSRRPGIVRGFSLQSGYKPVW